MAALEIEAFGDTVAVFRDIGRLPYGANFDPISRALPDVALLIETLFLLFDANRLRQQQDCVNVALNHIFGLLKPEDELHAETRVDLSEIRPGMFGTCDCLIYKPDGTLHVIDYKHGFGFVDVVNNSQLRYYALGALHKIMAAGKDVHTVVSTIVQPNAYGAEPVRAEAIDVFALLDWSSVLADAVKATEDPNAPLVPGDHCKFCPAAGVKCDALRMSAVKAATTSNGAIADPTKFDAAEMGRRLDEAELIAIYAERLIEHAKAEAKEGRLAAGYKWIAGKGNRDWNRPAIEVQRYVQNVTGVDISKPSEFAVITAAQAEAKLGKENYAKIESYIVKGRGAPQFVKESHKSKAVNYAEETKPKSALTAVE